MNDRVRLKILLCNIAMRPQPTVFPPIACTTLFNVLINAGYDPVFYDIDAKRPSDEELLQYFMKEKFDIAGISAVVSTGYKYTIKLISLIREASPKTKIIIGGNLAASYEILLRKGGADLCVIGEGEKVLLSIVKHYEEHGGYNPDNPKLHEIKGIAFLDSSGLCKYTGPEKIITSEEIQEPDYDLLEKVSNIDQYIRDPMTHIDFAEDERSRAPHRKGKKMATIFTSKGCVNRCTFCHRWVKGYRTIPVEKVIGTIKHLINKYNVGYFCISDECFGESRLWLEEFIRLIKPLDVLFQVGGARVSIIRSDPLIVSRLKDAGLTALYFGMESGCDKILKVMEKNATRSENMAAAKICAQAGIYTIIQLVIGMPGENDQTINETIEFINRATEIVSSPPLLSVNYLQSLPGTPTYEYLKHHGLIGNTIEDEERYLLKISDIDAAAFKQYLNVSEEPLSKVKIWQNKIILSAKINWLKRHAWKLSGDLQEKYYINKTNSLVFKIILFLKRQAITYRCIDMMGEYFWKVILFKSRYSLYGLKKTILITLGIIREEDRSRFRIGARSLREIVRKQV